MVAPRVPRQALKLRPVPSTLYTVRPLLSIIGQPMPAIGFGIALQSTESAQPHRLGERAHKAPGDLVVAPQVLRQALGRTQRLLQGPPPGHLPQTRRVARQRAAQRLHQRPGTIHRAPRSRNPSCETVAASAPAAGPTRDAAHAARLLYRQPRGVKRHSAHRILESVKFFAGSRPRLNQCVLLTPVHAQAIAKPGQRVISRCSTAHADSS